MLTRLCLYIKNITRKYYVLVLLKKRKKIKECFVVNEVTVKC